jgi:hypothetical protein
MVVVVLGALLLGCGPSSPAQVAVRSPPPTTATCDAFFGSASVTRLVGYLARLPALTAQSAASTDHRGGVFGALTRSVHDPAICGPSS